MSERNLKILDRRRSGETLAAIAQSYGISLARVRQIIEREGARLRRAAELREAAASPQQPSLLLLSPRLRSMLAKACGKPDFTPHDVIALDYTPAMFLLRMPGFRGKDWRDLCAWLEAAGLTLERPQPVRRRRLLTRTYRRGGVAD
jgi:hypothetical protein